MKNRNSYEGFKNAFNGVMYTLKNEHNFKIHIIMAFLVLVLSLFLELDIKEIVIIIIMITVVMVAELFNTAIEATVDLICGDKIEELAKIAKDTAAAAVLLTAICAVIVGYFFIIKKIVYNIFTKQTFVSIKKFPDYALVIILLIILIIYVISESLLKQINRDNLLNLNSLIASCIATMIFFISQNITAFTLATLLAIIVGYSSCHKKLIPIIVNLIMGFVITMLIFKSILHFTI